MSHHYVQYRRNGDRSYYSLATTGGGSQLRGVPYGEFDHVTWLTMEKDGRQVVNLKLDGILPADVVTEEESQRFRAFLAGTVVEVAPILVDDASGFVEGDIHVRLSNTFGEPVELSGSFDGLPLKGLSVDPEQVRLAAAANDQATLSVRVRFGETIDFARLSGAVFQATLRTPGPEGLSAERLIPVIIDRRHTCPPAAATADVAAPDFPKGGYGTDGAAVVLGDAANWNGPVDGSFRFAPSHTSDALVIDVRVTDERIEAGDSVEFFLDPGRPASGGMILALVAARSGWWPRHPTPMATSPSRACSRVARWKAAPRAAGGLTAATPFASNCRWRPSPAVRPPCQTS